MTRTSVEVVKALLVNRKDFDVVSALCTPDVTYVSLNYNNPDLKKPMPWCGTSRGPQAIVDTFVSVEQYWSINDFTPEDIFGEGENVAAFGRMTLTSTVLGKTVTSPFAIFSKVREGKVTYMQFMEDTFATSSSLRSGGVWNFRSDPAGGEVAV